MNNDKVASGTGRCSREERNEPDDGPDSERQAWDSKHRVENPSGTEWVFSNTRQTTSMRYELVGDSATPERALTRMSKSRSPL